MSHAAMVCPFDASIHFASVFSVVVLHSRLIDSNGHEMLRTLFHSLVFTYERTAWKV